jgi:pimeloyl-CoA synthetase|eukprot:COSAG01_NODE_109_length_25925_cov_48.384961_6_plen_99_part_00
MDPIVKKVTDKFKSRSEVGIKKYGTTLQDNNTDDFLNHLQEELMDAILYIEKLKSKRNEIEDEEPEMPEGGWECSECGAPVNNMNDVCSRSCFNAMMR